MEDLEFCLIRVPELNTCAVFINARSSVSMHA
jgi:hypothetical protein